MQALGSEYLRSCLLSGHRIFSHKDSKGDPPATTTALHKRCMPKDIFFFCFGKYEYIFIAFLHGRQTIPTLVSSHQ